MAVIRPHRQTDVLSSFLDTPVLLQKQDLDDCIHVDIPFQMIIFYEIPLGILRHIAQMDKIDSPCKQVREFLKIVPYSSTKGSGAQGDAIRG